MIFRTPAERAEQREFLAGQGKRTICDNCIRGHKQECNYDDCCCICNELQSAALQYDPVFKRMRQSDRLARNERIRELRAEGQKTAALAARFQVSLTTIQHIIHGRHDG